MLSVPNPFMRNNNKSNNNNSFNNYGLGNSNGYAGGFDPNNDEKSQFSHQDGDHLSLLNVYIIYIIYLYSYREFIKNNLSPDWCYSNFLNYRSLLQADNIRKQLLQICTKLHFPITPCPDPESDYIRKALVSGFFMQIAYAMRTGKDSYLTIKDNQPVKLHPSTLLSYSPNWILYNEFLLTSDNYVRTCCGIKGEWLLEIAPHYYNLEKFPRCDAKGELIRLEEQIIKDEEKKIKKTQTFYLFI